MKTFAVHTLGCKVNSYESEAMTRMMEAAGYYQVSFKSEADIYIINTCTVTNTGDKKSRQKIRQAVKANPSAVVCVVGCYAQVDQEAVSQMEGVDIVMGTQHRERLLDHIESHIEKKKQIVDVENIMRQKTFEGLEVTSFKENTRAFLKIQEGCNNYCTFCIIPFARGRIRSRLPEDVIHEARTLVEHGFQEIALTGIHTAGYGEDLDHYCFDDLIEALITKVPGLKRLRVSSIEASQITDRFIDMMKQSPIIVKHLHIPIQAGSDTILEAMRRKYTINEFKAKIEAIKQAVPNIAISTDVIVGFPGESEALYLQTVDNIKAIGFTSLHVFPYSPRRHTPAAKMDGQVDELVKQKRVQRLTLLSKQLAHDYAQLFMNKVVDVIFESLTERGYFGHSGEFLEVYVPTNQELKGQLRNVKIIEVTPQGCIGELYE